MPTTTERYQARITAQADGYAYKITIKDAQDGHWFLYGDHAYAHTVRGAKRKAARMIRRLERKAARFERREARLK